MNSSPAKKPEPKPTYDGHESFVGQMAKTMTRLLPNRITTWFNTRQNANGSSQMGESTDSSTEDESTDGPLPPPKKRIRLNLPGPSLHYTVPETRSISTNTEPMELNYHMANRSSYSLEPNLSTNTYEETSAILNKIEKSHYDLHDTFISSHQSSSRKRKSIDTNANSNNLNKPYDKEFGVLNEYKPFFRAGLAASSPFYREKTKYGGSYVNQPNIKSKETTHINISMNEHEATISNSTKEIMDLLDNFSSPTVEARRIPQITNMSINYSKNFMNTSKKRLDFRHKPLYIPSVASVLQLRNGSRLMRTTNVARQIIATPANSDYSNTPDHKYATKSRTRVTKAHQNVMKMAETVSDVNLPTATLQIDEDSLPSFNFSLPFTPRLNHENEVPSSKPREPIKKNVEISSPELDVVPTETNINIIMSDADKSTDSSYLNLTSTVGICATTSESLERIVEHNKIQNVTETVTEEEQENQCKDIKKCIECEIQLNQQQVQSDKCPDCEKVKSPEPLKVVVTGVTRRCTDCWVDDDEAKDKFSCHCGKKYSKTKSIEASIEQKDKDDQNSKTSIVNDMSDIKKLNVTSSILNSPLSLIVKQQSSKWECPNCMVRNENSTSKCVCCESEKPGTVKETQIKSFNYGISPNVSFKFGIDPMQNIPPKDNVTLTDSMVSQDKQSGTNNVLFGTEATAKPSEINKESSDAPKTTFSFGIPKDNPVTTVTPTSSSSTALDEPNIESDDRPKVTLEKGMFGIKPPSNILSPKTNNTLSNLNNFTMTQINTSTTTESVALPSVFTFSSNNCTPPSADLVNKSKSTTATDITTTLSNPIISSVQSPSSSMTFFSNSNTAGGSQQNASFKKNETETSVTLSIFPKSDSTTALFPRLESTTTANLSLFTKPESTTTTVVATQPLASNSLFSSSSNASQNKQQSPEKPKFTFPFGSNKSDTPKLFSAPPPFGSPYPNTIGSPSMSNTTMNTNTINNNVMTSNALGNNAMTSNLIGGNIMGNNTMVTNAVGGNTVGSTTFNNNILGNTSVNNNELFNNKGLSTGNPLTGLACDGLSNTLNPVNPLMVGSSSTSAIGGNIFDRVQKKDIWSGSNASGGNIFASSATSTPQNPTSFTFSGTTSFNANSSTFGGATRKPEMAQPAQGPPARQPAANIFGNAPSNQPLFNNTVSSQPAQPNVFGLSQPPAAAMGLFGASGFGAPSATFENITMNPTQATAYNFGALNNQTNMFRFSQRPPAQQTPGVYNFGPPTGTSTPQVQFNMGSAPQSGRRVRKVIRRTTAR